MTILTAPCNCTFTSGAWLTATCKHGREFALNTHNRHVTLFEVTESPKIVCLCGSTRFYEAFQRANFEETMKGNIVLSIGCDTKSDDNLFFDLSKRELIELKRKLDTLHFRKIDMADEVLILNVDGYIGESTNRELSYAKNIGKGIRFLER